jgi:cob(I)alamin adenosyltransferase
LNDEAFKKELKEIQDRLFTIGSSLATDAEKEPKMKLPDLNDETLLSWKKESTSMTEPCRR